MPRAAPARRRRRAAPAAAKTAPVAPAPPPPAASPRPGVDVVVHLSAIEHAALTAVAKQRRTQIEDLLREGGLAAIRYRAG